MKPPTINTTPGRLTERMSQRSCSVQANEASLSVTWESVPLGEALAAEMRRSWREGQRRPAESFLDQHRELWQRPDDAVDLIYEEYCLRQAEGPEQVEQDILRRFPQWAEPLRVMLDCHQLLQPADELPKFPDIGDTVGEFRLLAELGHGSRGQVFLATQMGLADRPVVLKMTPREGGEHLSLARLQHTNIVPLYSCTDDPARKIRILCMPYYGRATLAEVAKSLANVPLSERTGQLIVAAIDRLQDSSASTCVQAGAARQMLSHVSYVQAMCWITACLADALQFAHERGLVHLDLKPSNVLMSGDGLPMLLDFHLAHAPIAPDSVFPENFGGTPGYMPAEQQAAMKSLQSGQPVRCAVDGRADIYALGAMLYQALGGTLPFETGSTRLSDLNPQASAGLSDIVAKCLANRAQDRYQTAAALADDLRRHLTDQPLVGVGNRNLPERFRKWRRRRPSTVRTAAILAVAAGAVALMLGGVWRQRNDLREQAHEALADGRAQLQNFQSRDTAKSMDKKASDFGYAEAARTLERGLKYADGLPFEEQLRQQLRAELATAKRLHLARQLHDFAEEVRAAYSVESVDDNRLRSLASQGREFWKKRNTITTVLESVQAPEVRADLQDIALFVAELQVKLNAAKPAARHEALRMLDEVETMFGPSAVLECQREIHRQKLGVTMPEAPTRSPPPPPRTAWENYAVGRAYLASGDLAQASEKLTSALTLDPAGRWPNFYYGVCAFRLGRHEDALAAFSVCIGTAPNSAACFYNRGLVYAALDRPVEALRDYERAVEIDPTLANAAGIRTAEF